MSASGDIPATIAAVPNHRNFTTRGPSRTLCILLDGTGDQFDCDNSNVVKLFGALKKDSSQKLYYQPGIGTYSGSGKLQSGISSASDMAVGSGLGTHIKEAYSFLMSNYTEGDKICIFGFSRGAYTARALTGMLLKIGLLPANNSSQVAFAYKQFKDDTPTGWEQSALFKTTFCIDVKVHFLGCWDTVASVGFIPRQLPFAKNNTSCVRYFRHAMALDERRAKFKVSHWEQRAHDATPKQSSQKVTLDETPSLTPGAMNDPRIAEKRAAIAQELAMKRNSSISAARRLSSIQFTEEPASIEPAEGTKTPTSNGSGESGSEKKTPGSPSRRKSLPLAFRRNSQGPQGDVEERPKLTKAQTQEALAQRFTKLDQREFGGERFKTDALEVWFAGAHADVGGGAVGNDTRHALSNIPLRWMIRQTFACDTGILYNADVLADYGMDVHTLYPTLVERPRPFCGPPPSAIDRYASGTLPSLAERRKSIRKSRADALARLENNDGIATFNDGVGEFAPPVPSHQQLDTPRVGKDRFHLRSNSYAGLTGREEDAQLPEAWEDYFDALAPINDQLKDAKGWWILEVYPTKHREQQHDGKWKKVVGMNLGRYRTIRDDVPKVHYSVLQRKQAQGYEIRNVIGENSVIEYVM
ncbi:hypothetical protein IE81DRAFT_324280 [Ceraceosorus guamensis]|uniref:T6SS Phospholipase effector Tle1-like catalytic domain-containing protein n=1 Tax=Ceraceosorus guamensis TaxID=1522189 RepID=A0A316VW35_9BASI|nr:hypothetical protein IE81DRAFT_324280 [Ceraceosorus guamensis]PWN41652.1 hypothetical protein IE81DRAFT_324280 [Ceraceosorus guamensis]